MRAQRALWALDGVGDAQLGEWHESSPRAYHVRRRLTDHERAQLPDGPNVRLIRGTDEARLRFAQLPRQTQRLVPAFILDDEVIGTHTQGA